MGCVEIIQKEFTSHGLSKYLAENMKTTLKIMLEISYEESNKSLIS